VRGLKSGTIAPMSGVSGIGTRANTALTSDIPLPLAPGATYPANTPATKPIVGSARYAGTRRVDCCRYPPNKLTLSPNAIAANPATNPITQASTAASCLGRESNWDKRFRIIWLDADN
jgi:hypothetical protein